MGDLFKLADEHPVTAFLLVVLLMFGGALGVGPMRAMSTNLRRRAETSSVEEELAQGRARRSDNLEESYQGIALRAINEKNAAIDEKNAAAALNAEAMHAFNNRAQDEIARIQLASKEQVKNAEDREKVAVARAVAAEALVEGLRQDIEELKRTVRRQERRIDALTGIRGLNDTDLGDG